MEPLTVLREFASSGRLIQVRFSPAGTARTVRFGDQFEFGADAPTRWRAKGAGASAGASSATLPLGALAFFATSPTFFDKAPWGDYLKNARSAGFATVAVVDRKVNIRRRWRKQKKGRGREISRSHRFPLSTSRKKNFKNSRSPTSSWESTTAPTTSWPLRMPRPLLLSLLLLR